MTRRAALERVPREAWVAMFITSLGTFLTAIDLTAVTVALPSIGRDFDDVSRATLSFVVSGYTMTLAALFLIAGRLAERHGPKRVFSVGVATFGIASALAGLAPSAAVLIGARCLQGMSGALIMPSAIAISLPLFPPGRRSTAIAFMFSLGSGASAIGPTAGAALVDSAGWRWVFYINLPIVAAVLALARRRVPNVPGRPGDPFDTLGVPIGALSIALAVLALSHGPEWGWTSTTTMATFAGSLVLLPLFLRRSLTHPRPLLDMTLFRARTYAYGTAALAALRFAVFGFYVLLPIFFTEVMGYSTWKTGLAMIPNPVVGTLVAIPCGRLTDRIGPRVMAIAAGVFWIIGLMWWATFLDPGHSYPVGYLPGAVFWGAGMGISQTSITSGSLRDLAGERFGLASATQNTIGQLAASLGLAFAIAVLGDAHGLTAVEQFHRTYRVLAALSLLTIFLCWRGLPGPVRRGPDQAGTGPDPDERAAHLAVEPERLASDH